MDGFPNGRRLEDDVTTIELQAVGGLVLAAVGLGFDDATSGAYADLASAQLVKELTYNAGPTANDLPILTTFPYEPAPHRGYDYVKRLTSGSPVVVAVKEDPLGGLASAPLGNIVSVYPNPSASTVNVDYVVTKTSAVRLIAYDIQGKSLGVLANQQVLAGKHTVQWETSAMPNGAYLLGLEVNGQRISTQKVSVNR
jgi:hypothetical protein